MQSALLQSSFCLSIKIRNADSIPLHLKCDSCSQLLIDGLQTRHGCRLCQQCVTSELLPDRCKICPCINSVNGLNKIRDVAVLDKYLVRQECFFPDIATRNEVLKLEVHCPNAESGCQKQLTLKQLDSHLADECELQLATCDLCSERIEQFKLNGSHRNLQSADCCSKFRAPCPRCGDSSKMLDRLEFAEHLKTCPERPSDCKYRESVGCDTTNRMSQMVEHYSSGADNHLELTVQHFQRAMENKDAELSKINQTVKDLLARDEQKDAKLQEMQRKLAETHQQHLDSQKKQEIEMKKMQQQLDALKLQSQIRGRRNSNSLAENSAEEENQSQMSVRVCDEGISPSKMRRRMSLF